MIDKQCEFENELFRRFNEIYKIKEVINKESEFLDYVLDTSTEMQGVELLPELFSGFKQKIMIGPWVHNTGNRKVGELDYGEEADLDDNALMVRWFDSQLKDKDNGIIEEPPVRIFVMGENRWRFENEWPLARTEYVKYYLNSNGGANTLAGDGMLGTKMAKQLPELHGNRTGDEGGYFAYFSTPGLHGQTTAFFNGLIGQSVERYHT